MSNSNMINGNTTSSTGGSGTVDATTRKQRMGHYNSVRDAKRFQIQGLFQEQKTLRERMQQIDEQMKQVENELMKLDETIEELEDQEHRAAMHHTDNSSTSNIHNSNNNHASITPSPPPPPAHPSLTMNSDEHIPDPSATQRTQTQSEDILPEAEDFITHVSPPINHPVFNPNHSLRHSGSPLVRTPSASSGIALAPLALTITSTKKRSLPTSNNTHQASLDASKRTLVDFFATPSHNNNGNGNTNDVARMTAAAASSSSSSSVPHASLPQHETFIDIRSPNVVQMQQRSPQPRSTFPWDNAVQDLLHNTFRIPSFRDSQRDIINATLQQKDVFVIMRTGGGKSLTYQLPALLEGRYPQRLGSNNIAKITLVISPLLSLIHDQEQQMNAFCPNSAMSFTSGMTGGNAEHARRWSLVRDPTAGVCLLFVTPERVTKSGKLKGELEKLHQQGRLGRFVIDECHCACQWGHDFRPDYAQLGILKQHFPHVPVLAVTATASDQVLKDCCRILKISRNHTFFRSTANRPNLIYSIRPKDDGAQKVLDDMAAFIKEHHRDGAGIIYTYSKKDADTVADQLCTRGIVARSYHSNVTPTQKASIHSSWMRNDTQVVVATIAFGLGINKPDVRFVLHHTLSKTLEAYYQESGRAGRDGLPADCILYYSPKDVSKVIKLTHGQAMSDSALFWSMVRYAQAFGDDAVCRATILNHLDEPNAPNLARAVKENTCVEMRDVGSHAKTLVQLMHEIQRNGEKVTLPMLVKGWRATGARAYDCVKENPPNKELTTAECERMVIALVLMELFNVEVIWNAYDAVVYLKPGNQSLVQRLLAKTNPQFSLQFPKKEFVAKKAATGKNSPAATTKAATAAKKRRASAVGTKKVKKAAATKKAAKKPRAKKATAAAKRKAATGRKAAPNASLPRPSAASEIIELSDDDDDDDSPIDVTRFNGDEVIVDDDITSVGLVTEIRSSSRKPQPISNLATLFSYEGGEDEIDEDSEEEFNG